MRESIEAIYEHGVFRPLEHLDFSEGQHAQIVVKALTQETVDEILKLAAQVYKGLSEQDVEEIEKITMNRREFFRRKIL